MPDPLLGCRIETLADCYASLGVDCYQSGLGGILCRFGNTLLLSGDCEPDGLAEFSSLLGITRIEGINGRFIPPPGWKKTLHPLLVRPSAPSAQGRALESADASERMREVFSLLCQADPLFSQQAEYLPWLSDLTRRKNRGRARVYLLDGLATACISAIGSKVGWLCAVAVSPASQKSGLGTRLLLGIAAECDTEGLTLVTAAQNASLLSFYRRIGFSSTGQSLLAATAPTSYPHLEGVTI